MVYIFLFTTVILIDRLTKFLALTLFDQVYTVTSFLSFDLIFNRGIAGGFFNGWSQMSFLLVTGCIGFIMTVLLVHTQIRWRNNKIIIGELLTLAGGLSNLIDRFMYQGVVDFIVFSVNGWAWPAFNCADASVVIGIGIILYCSVYE